MRSDGRYRDLLRGASILSTGGGGDMNKGEELFEEIPDDVEVRMVEEMDEDAEIVMAYGLGSAEQEESSKKKAISEALEVFIEKYPGGIDAVIPGELGPTQLYSAFQAASILDVPVIDADTESGRCVPKLSMSFLQFDENGEAPVVISDGAQNTVSIDRIDSIEKLEDILRSISKELGLIGGVGHRRNLLDIKPYILEGTLSKAKEVGRTAREEGLDALKKFEEIEFVDKAEVEKIEKRESLGFYTADAFIEDYSIGITNEYLEMEKDGEIIAEPPERIFLVNIEQKKGVYSCNLQEGMNVAIFTGKPEGLWKTEKGKQLFENHLPTEFHEE